MADSHDAARLAAVCRELDTVTVILGPNDGADALERLLTAAKASRPITEELRDVDAALVRAGVAGGLHGVTSRMIDHSRLLGADADDGKVSFFCPEGRCDRRWSPSSPADEIPECAVFGPDLKWKSS
ncbi:hypothetical protein [Kibdelosporangium phytohabitans]|uniref:Uncharacterized protein n=1 Tax=Kibdelosporangium phytohabitans TaxID=860235 RepID=A0A0N9HW75_9PSEU|nr:hypothetical protein [Kibdelosporangium phytohabitans]ALG06385.1 hypothetical protein AOZ06_05100 [Kibdelosporangium phytohabitans]MBE1467532.1 hypothetical protein [Kibdelosporangium phytohabitans]